MDSSLIAQAHALPPELYNQIRTEVLSSPDLPSADVRINAAYQFQYHLHIDRASRQEFLCRPQATEFTFTSWDLLIKFFRVAHEMTPRPDFAFNMVRTGNAKPDCDG